jgi:outer membrane protein OmpA-like peptidoglycan-associated protein
MLYKILFYLFFCLCLAAHLQAQQYSIGDKKAIALYQKGLEAQNQKNYKGALSYYNRALERDPSMAEALFGKGQLAELQADPASTYSFYDAAVKAAPNLPSIAYAFFYLGKANFDVGQFKKCLDLLGSFVRLAPKNAVLLRRAKKMIANAEFAQEAIKTPLKITPISLGKGVNVFHSQYFPSLTGDKEMLVFTGFNRSTQDENLYVSYLKNLQWTYPTPISANINTSENEGTAAISADGRTLVFTACNSKTGFGSCDLYISYRTGNEWSKAINLGENINTREWESQPSLSADGSILYFVSDRRGGIGSRDIYVSHKNDQGQWQIAQNIGNEINTADDEISPFIHPNGITLFFASNGYPGLGGMDLYFADKTNEHWSKPQNFGYPINTQRDQVSLFITADNRSGYYSLEQNQESDNRNSLLYQFEIPAALAKKIKKANIVKGVVSDAKTKKKLGAEIEVYNLKNNNLESKVRSDEQTGEYLNTLNEGGKYGLYVNKMGYFFKNLSLDYSEETDSTSKTINISLEPLLSNSKEVLNNIYFDTNKYEIKPESKPELDELLRLLQMNPKMTIEISGHTDNVGSDAANVLLSKNRAKAIVDHLLTKGIPATRLRWVGYGKQQPAVENTTEANRAKNRRIEIKILNI